MQDIDAESIRATELYAAREFLEYDLRESAEQQRDRANDYDDDPEDALLIHAIADRLEELADEVADVSSEAFTQYAKARDVEMEISRDFCDFVHCSMTMEIGGAINPKDINDLCRIYANAVECVRHSRFAEEGNMADFWTEFAETART